MKVKISDGQLYDVRWERVRRPLKRNHEKYGNGVNIEGKKFLINTFCVISTVDETKEKEEKYNFFSNGHALQSKKDPYDKIFGRKLSFTRALNKFERKEDRTIFWNMYKQCCRLI